MSMLGTRRQRARATNSARFRHRRAKGMRAIARVRRVARRCKDRTTRCQALVHLWFLTGEWADDRVSFEEARDTAIKVLAL